jgi:hypothetical protein
MEQRLKPNISRGGWGIDGAVHIAFCCMILQHVSPATLYTNAVWRWYQGSRCCADVVELTF